MINQINSIINQFATNAKVLGGLDPCSIWALIATCSIIILAWVLRQNFKSRDTAMKIRLEEAKADAEMTAAIEKMADQIRELRYTITGKGGTPDAKVA